MTSQGIIDIMNQAMWTALMLTGPALGFALLVGLFFAVFQAVTSIQEQSLIFVPKIVAVAVTLLVLMGWMARVMIAFTTQLYVQIGTVGP